jgi:hypothetical protein
MSGSVVPPDAPDGADDIDDSDRGAKRDDPVVELHSLVRGEEYHAEPSRRTMNFPGDPLTARSQFQRKQLQRHTLAEMTSSSDTRWVQ